MRIQTLGDRRARRKARSRAKTGGTKDRPRLSVFRSNRYTYAQLIDDEKGRTLVSASTKEVAREGKKKTDQAILLGVLLAEKSKKAGISSVVLHKGAYKYHGRVKAVAEGARQTGLLL